MSYAYYRTITFSPITGVASDLPNFPALFSGTFPYLANQAYGGLLTNSSGYDLIFTSDSAGNNLLDWEIESYSPTTGILNIWIKLPVYSSNFSTLVYMFYGNSAINTFQGNTNGTWDSNYLHVYHLNFTNAEGDSTASNLTLTPSNSPAINIGKVDGALQFQSGSQQYLLGIAGDSPAALTFECWVNGISWPNTYNTPVSYGLGGSNLAAIYVRSDGKLAASVQGTSGLAKIDGTGINTLVADNATWYHLVLTYSATTGLYLYVDGVIDSSIGAGGTISVPLTAFAIAEDALTNPGKFFNGTIDEVRVSNTVRSNAYITASYQMQLAPSNWFAVSLQVLNNAPVNTRLTQAARVQLWMNNPTYYTTSDLNNSIQDGLDEICALTGCIYKSAVLPFSAGKSYYDMLTLFPDYIGMVGIFNVTIKRWMIPQTIRKYDQSRIDWEAAAGVPYYWAPVSHRYIAIFKKPISVNYGDMWIYYRASAPTLSDTTQIPIPDDHIQVLDAYNIKDLWEQQQEFTKASGYFETYKAELEQLRKLIRARTNSDRIPSLRGSGGNS